MIGEPFWWRVAKASTNLLIALSAVVMALALLSKQAPWLLNVFPFALFVLVVVRLALSRYAKDRVWKLAASSPLVASSDATTAVVSLAEATFLSRYGDKELMKQLVGLLVDPSGYFGRVKESVSIEDTRYESTVTMTFATRGERRALVPVALQRKKDLVDSMSLSVNGSAGSTLTFIENQGAILLAVSSIYNTLWPDGDVRLLERVKRCIASPDVEANERVVEDLRAMPMPAGATDADARTANAPTWVEALVELVQVLSRSYFMLALVDHPKTVPWSKVTIKRSIAPETLRGRRGFKFREVLGLKSREHVFWLARTGETSSYHFSFDAPDGMYVYNWRTVEIAVPGLDDLTMPSASVRRALAPDRLESVSDQSLHLYYRDRVKKKAATAESTHLFLGISLRERPPALMEAGLLLSAYLAVTVWTAGLFHDQIFRASPLPGSWPTVLFGIPTLLSGWLVARITGEALKRMSVVSVAMTVWLAVNSALAVFTAAFKSADVELTDTALDLWFIHLEHPIWGTLMLVTALHLALGVVFVVSRAGRYWVTINSGSLGERSRS